MKILNLYAGIGGNRELWNEHEVTAVEYNREIADVYAARFPWDTVVVGDAVKYMEDNYHKFDFIWASPPCPSHGQLRHNRGVIGGKLRPLVPDMTLYGIIIFLRTNLRHPAGWVVENTIPYYQPIIKPSAKVHRHLWWSNFIIEPIDMPSEGMRYKSKISDWDKAPLVQDTPIKNKRQVLRNCVDGKVGQHVLDCFIRSGEYKRDLFF